MRYTAYYVKARTPAECKEIEAASHKEALTKARRACPPGRRLGHITGNHTGDVVWDSESHKKKLAK